MITFQLTALHHKLTHKVLVEIFNLKAMSWLLSKGWWWKLDENIVGSGKTGTVSHFLDSSPFSVALGLKGRSPFCQMTINTVAFTAASQTFPLSIRGTQSTHLLAFNEERRWEWCTNSKLLSIFLVEINRTHLSAFYKSLCQSDTPLSP